MFHNIAILIDADNASPKLFPEVFAQIEKLGKIGCRKIYGDWAQTNLNSWQENILKYALDAMQQFAYVKGKNATDIALVIDAMDLLYSGQYDCFCLVSSDSDFASLAIRIRKNNIDVYGFGEQKAVSSFRQACTKFVEINPSKTVTTPNTITPAPKVTATPSPTVQKYTIVQLQKETAFIQAIQEILEQQKDEWMDISTIPTQLKQNYKIDWNKYGYNKFSDLIIALRYFEIKKEENIFFIKSKLIKIETKINKYTTSQLQKEVSLIQAIKEILEQQKVEWVNVSIIASLLKSNYPVIKLNKYGYKKISDLVIALNCFITRKEKNAFYVKKAKDISIQNMEQVSKPKQPYTEEQLIKEKQLMTILQKILKKEQNEWVNINIISTQLKTDYPEVDIQNYGYQKLSKLIKKIKTFNTIVKENSLFVKNPFYKQTTTKITSPSASMKTKYTIEQLQQETIFINAIQEILEQHTQEWVNIARMPTLILQQYKLDWKKYGYAKFSDLIKALQLFEIKLENSTYFIKNSSATKINSQITTDSVVQTNHTVKPKKVQNDINNDDNELNSFIYYYKLATTTDDINAQYQLAQCYAQGKGVTQNLQIAIKWYISSAEKGHLEANKILAKFYEQNKDYINAFKCFVKIAKTGDLSALFKVGYYVQHGLGTTQNKPEAFKCYLHLAHKGYMYAQYQLALCYEKGDGIEQNLIEAIKWYTLSAQQGYSLAKDKLVELK